MLRRAKPLFHQLLGLAILMVISCHQAVAQEAERWGVNMTQGVTPISKDIFWLHNLIFWICVVIGVVVFSALFWTMFAHRKSKGHQASQFHEHLGVEIAWTVVPFVILVAMAFPSTKTLIDIYDTEADVDMDIVITGYQWRWQYEYLGQDVKFFSSLDQEHNEARQLDSGIDPYTIPNYLLEVDKPLVLPIKKKVRFLITANDVLHAWWVPDLGVKRDAIPGFVNETWAYIEEPGIYRGQCAELCGKDHGFMPIVVKAVEEAEYNTWLEERRVEAAALAELTSQTFTFEDLLERGEGVYNRSCSACHGATGDGVPGVFPAIRDSAIARGPIAAHLDIVKNGSQENPAMQAFGEQLSPVDIAAVITYQRNAFGNDMGDSMQPVDVLQSN